MEAADSFEAKLGFMAADGILNLEVTNADGIVLATATTTDTGGVASLTGLGAGTYYIRVSGAGIATNPYSLAVDRTATSTTRVLYVNDGTTAGDYYSLAPGDDANDGKSPDTPKATLRDMLADYTLGPHDLVLIDTGTYGGASVVITAADEGAAYAGTPAGSNFNYSGTRFDLSDADFNLIYGLRLPLVSSKFDCYGVAQPSIRPASAISHRGQGGSDGRY